MRHLSRGTFCDWLLTSQKRFLQVDKLSYPVAWSLPLTSLLPIYSLLHLLCFEFHRIMLKTGMRQAISELVTENTNSSNFDVRFIGEPFD